MPTTAEIYINELRKGFDDTVLPVFTPDTAFEVGSICSFEDGRLVARGHVRDRAGTEIPSTAGASTPSWTFASEGSIDFSPVVEVNLPDGSTAFSADLKLGGKRSVVASFADVVETTANDADEVDRIMWELYLAGRLREDRVVVWSVRAAASGTVVVSNERNAGLSLSAPVAQRFTLTGLAAGVTVEQAKGVAYTVSNASLTAFVRAKRITPQGRHDVEDVRRFDRDRQSELRKQSVSNLTVDDLLGGST